MPERHVFDCVPRVRGLIAFNSILVYQGEEKESGLRPFWGKSPLA